MALLACAELLPGADDRRVDAHELDEQMEALVPAFQEEGMKIETVLWQNILDQADSFDLVLPLLVWDYVEGSNHQLFLSTMEKVEEKTLLRNSLETLRWNGNKQYLEELQRKGAPVIPSITVQQVSTENITAAFQTLGASKLVIKPLVGANAWRQVLYTKGEKFPTQEELPPCEAMIQPFIENVQREGEYSFVYFNGQYSHAVKKLPKSGDYRIQSSYGGFETSYDPSAEEKELGAKILGMLELSIPLYARVDLIRGDDGDLKLIEIELIEPYLYLPYATTHNHLNSAALMFAKHVRALLDSVGDNK